MAPKSSNAPSMQQLARFKTTEYFSSITSHPESDASKAERARKSSFRGSEKHILSVSPSIANVIAPESVSREGGRGRKERVSEV